MDNSENYSKKNPFELQDKLFNRISLSDYIISNKLLDSDFFEYPLTMIIDDYKTYVNNHRLNKNSLTKNIESYFNFRLLRYSDAYFYRIVEISSKQLLYFISENYKKYKLNNKYSSFEGFLQNDWQFNYLKQRIDYVVDCINSNKFKFICTTPKKENVFNLLSNGLDTYYCSMLNLIELHEYLSLIKKDIEDFNPDKNKDQSSGSEIKNPFEDKKTYKLFNYIVDKWDYDRGQKWADIYTIIKDLYEYKTPEPKDYQKYIIQRYGYTGKFQYNIISKKMKTSYQNL